MWAARSSRFDACKLFLIVQELPGTLRKGQLCFCVAVAQFDVSSNVLSRSMGNNGRLNMLYSLLQAFHVASPANALLFPHVLVIPTVRRIVLAVAVGLRAALEFILGFWRHLWWHAAKEAALRAMADCAIHDESYQRDLVMGIAWGAVVMMVFFVTGYLFYRLCRWWWVRNNGHVHDPVNAVVVGSRELVVYQAAPIQVLSEPILAARVVELSGALRRSRHCLREHRLMVRILAAAAMEEQRRLPLHLCLAVVRETAPLRTQLWKLERRVQAEACKEGWWKRRLTDETVKLLDTQKNGRAQAVRVSYQAHPSNQNSSVGRSNIGMLTLKAAGIILVKRSLGRRTVGISRRLGTVRPYRMWLIAMSYVVMSIPPIPSNPILPSLSTALSCVPSYDVS